MRFLFLLFLISPMYSQVSVTVYDNNAKVPVSYANVWFKNKNGGAVANRDGRITFTNVALNDSVVISAVGYEKTVLSLSGISDTVFLKPQPILLDEVIIGRKKDRKAKIGTLKNKETLVADFTGRGNAEGRYSIARYFSQDDVYEEMPFLTGITVRAYSKYKNQYFAITVRSVGENGKPDKFLNAAPILCQVKTGRRSLLKVDMSKFNIKVPADGFFITLEKFQKDPEIVDKSFGPFVVMCKKSNSKDTIALRYKDGYWLWDYFSNQEIAMEIEVGN